MGVQFENRWAIPEDYSDWVAFELNLTGREILSELYETWPVVTGWSRANFYIVVDLEEVDIRNPVHYVPYVEAQQGHIERAVVNAFDRSPHATSAVVGFRDLGAQRTDDGEDIVDTASFGTVDFDGIQELRGKDVLRRIGSGISRGS